MHSESGSYHGFFWFYFFNEHILRFLNLRYPRDYNTVPRLYFWLFHFLWLFPWAVYLPSVFRRELSRRGSGGENTAARGLLGWLRPHVLFALDYAGVLLDALLSGHCAFVGIGNGITLSAQSHDQYAYRCRDCLARLRGDCFYSVQDARTANAGRHLRALNQHPDLYTLSLGHMLDLTWSAFAYLRLPLAIAGIATLIGAAGAWFWQSTKAYLRWR